MLSLFGILNMGGQSMQVQQEATALTGQNLANVNNPNYAEENVQIAENTPLQTSTGDEGTGVEAVTITSMRDALLDAQIASEDSVTGSLSAQQTALQQAEAYLNESLSSSATDSTSAATSANGLTADLNSFFNSLQTLSANPSSIPDRQAVVQSAQQLAEQFNNVSSGLTTVNDSLNATVQDSVTTVNQDLSQIADLNQQIMEAQSAGASAEQLTDQREKLIENLSGYANITTTPQGDGSVTVSLGGLTMVSEGQVTDGLTATTTSGQPAQVTAQSGGALNLTSGSIEGNITAQSGAIATLSNSIDTLASSLITSVNQVYQNGYDLNGNNLQSQFFTGTGASDIAVNQTVATDPSTFQAAGTQGNPGDNTIVLQMANLANQSMAGLGNQTLSQNYSDAVDQFGSSLQSVNEQLSNSQSVSQMLTTQRSSASGVNEDTELANLLQFQKAYEASAELISTVNQMLTTVIGMKSQ